MAKLQLQKRATLAAVAALTALAAAASGGCSSSAPGEETIGQTGQAVDTICGEAPSASLDGFPVYAYCGNFNVYTDNGIDTRSYGGSGWTQTEGGYGYQCVEWAVRYFYFKWNVSHGWFVAYAKDMCGSHPAGVSTTNSPIHGDLAVFTPGCAGADSTAGHVAAIDTVSSSSIGVVQENPAGRMTWPRSCVMCYLHAANNGNASDPCSTAPLDGLYCGQSTQWGGGTPNVLYDCVGGATKSATPCPYGCHLAPYKTNDSCNPPPPDAGSDAAAAHDAASAHDGAATDAAEVLDGAAMLPPPAPAPAATDNASPPAPPPDSSGCAMGAGRREAPHVALLLLAAWVPLARRRQRQRRSACTVRDSVSPE